MHQQDLQQTAAIHCRHVANGQRVQNRRSLAVDDHLAPGARDGYADCHCMQPSVQNFLIFQWIALTWFVPTNRNIYRSSGRLYLYHSELSMRYHRKKKTSGQSGTSRQQILDKRRAEGTQEDQGKFMSDVLNIITTYSRHLPLRFRSRAFQTVWPFSCPRIVH